jgi:hypothetical protein
MVPEGETSVQSLLRNVYCTKEIAYFPFSILLMADYNDNKTTSFKVNAEIKSCHLNLA